MSTLLTAKAIMNEHKSDVAALFTKSEIKAIAKEKLPIFKTGETKAVLPAAFSDGLMVLSARLSTGDMATWELIGAYNAIARYATEDACKDAIVSTLAQYGKTLGTMRAYSCTYELFDGAPEYDGVTFTRHHIVAPLYRAAMDVRTSQNKKTAILGVLNALAQQVRDTPELTDTTFKAIVLADSIALNVNRQKRRGKDGTYKLVANVVVKDGKAIVDLPAKSKMASGQYTITFVVVVPK